MKRSPDSRRRFLQSTAALIALPAIESLGFRRVVSAADAVAVRPEHAVFLDVVATLARMGFRSTQAMHAATADSSNSG